MKRRCTLCLKLKPINEFGKAHKAHSTYTCYRRQCKLCLNEKHNKYMRTNKVQKAKKFEYDKQWRLDNPGKAKQYRRTRVKQARAYTRERRKNLTDGYVRGTLSTGTSLNESEIPQELVDAQREFIKLFRLLGRNRVNAYE